MAWHDVVARMQMDDMVYHVHGNGIWWKQIQPWHTNSDNRSVVACFPTQLCGRCTVASIYAPECKCHSPKLRELIIQVEVIVCVHILCSLSQLNTGAHFHNIQILENLPLFCAPARDIFHIDLSWASWRSANRCSGFSSSHRNFAVKFAVNLHCLVSRLFPFGMVRESLRRYTCHCRQERVQVRSGNR